MCTNKSNTDTLPAHDPEQAIVWHESGDGRVHGHPVGIIEETETVDVHVALLDKNDRLAERNRRLFAARKITAINLVSSPGSGKTALLSRTLSEFGPEAPCAVLVGDLETDNDARRMRGRGAPVVQITTGNACHLDAEMVASGLEALPLDGVKLLFVENVGNLVCPASFDLGESIRVVLLSCSEGEDKPLKYPPIFQSADVVLLTKTDVAEPLEFNRALAVANIKRVAPQAMILETSSRAPGGLEGWYSLLRRFVSNR